MNLKIIKNTLGTVIFSCISCMGMEKQSVIDYQLHGLITSINKSSLLIVTALKQYAQQSGTELTPANILSLLKPEQKDVDKLFLNNIADDQLRSLTLSIGANINAHTEDGRTCLFFTDKPKVITELIEKGAQVNTRGKSGDPLSYLLYYKPKAIDAAKVLLEHGANPNIIPTLPGAEPLLIQAVEQENQELTMLLCEHQAEVNMHNSSGKTPLMISIKKSNINLVTILLKKYANPNLPDNYGTYPLHLAIPDTSNVLNESKKIVPQIVVLLLQHNANPNQPYPYKKKTPLHQAVEMDNIEIVKRLFEHKANTHAIDDDGFTPYTLAQKLKRPKIMSILSGIPSIEEKQLEMQPSVKYFETLYQTSRPINQDQRYCLLQ